MTARCDYSDLPADSCAHCLGDDPTITNGGDARRYDDAPAGTVTWSGRRAPREHYRPRPKLEPTLDPMVQVARNLRAIIDMTGMLADRSIDLADSHDMPGGDATVARAPVALPSGWARRTELAERAWMDTHAVAETMGTRVAADHDSRPTLDDDDDLEPALQALLYWSEEWRHQLGMDYGQDPTLVSEASFLANADVLTWAHDHEPRWDHFVTAVADTVTRLENIVQDGIRETRSRVVCSRCEKPHRLILVHGKGDRPDRWKCPGCKHRYDDDELRRAHAQQMRAEGAAKWVDRTEAIGVLRAQGWRESTVREWIEKGPEILTRRDETTGRVSVWWPDVWRRHLVARGEQAARARDAAKLAERREACQNNHDDDCWDHGGKRLPGQLGCRRSAVA